MSYGQQFTLHDDIQKIIQTLYSNKTHGHDVISSWTVKLFDASFCKPLELIFKSYLERGKFPLKSRKENVVPAHKKEISKYSKITSPYLCFPLPGKYLKEYLERDTMTVWNLARS